MDTASYQFVAFGLAVALVSNFSRSRVWRSIVLLLASIVFLGLLAHNPIVFLPLAGFLLLGYVGACAARARLVQVQCVEHSGSYLHLYLAEEIYLSPAKQFFTPSLLHAGALLYLLPRAPLVD